jgi:hypothetical protein
LELAVPSIVAFVASNRNSHKLNQRNYSSRNPQGRTGGHGRGQGRPSRCQICRVEGHYADQCKQRYNFHGHAPEAQLAKALTSSCSISGNEASDWYLDTGALAHMTSAHCNLDQSTSYTSKDCVIVGNGASLPITHTSTISPSLDLKLLDVLVVPHITKNLLSISKLTNDFPFSVTFIDNFFTIQNRQTGMVVATGRRDGGLYVLECGNSTFVSVLKNKSLYASYDLWHARLGHVNHSIISLLNKQGQLHLTSLLPSPVYVVHVNLQRITVCLILVMNIDRRRC